MGFGDRQRPLLCLMGPTAAGKTDAAVVLVSRLPVDIISVDSAMVYRGMDIGTGKPGGDVLAKAPHRLIDIREPAETYSAAAFVKDAESAIAEIHAAGRIPLLVGGTGLYFRALNRGLSRLPSADADIRAELEEDMRREGVRRLHARLADVDPVSARRIHPNDPQRIQRALEVFRLTGAPMSRLLEEHSAAPAPYPCIAASLEPGERGWLHDRIAARFESMLRRGLVDEVAGLKASGRLSEGMSALRAVGYRQVWQYLEGDGDLCALKGRGIAATRQLARRQLTWLRHERGLRRFDCTAPDAAKRLLSYFTDRLKAC